MAGAGARDVPSGPMEATPAVDPRSPLSGAQRSTTPPAAAASTRADAAATEAEQMSLGRRLRQPRTIISIAIPVAIIGGFVALNGEQLKAVPALILNANPWLVLAAFLVFYSGFPLRGVRWTILLRGTGMRVPVKDSTEIIGLSWVVNCIVPAKLGDVYRAYLLKINSTASLSPTFGTIFIERVLDLFAIALMGLAAGYWSFRDGLPPAIQVVFGVALVVMAVLAIGLFTMRNFGRRIIVAAALPAAPGPRPVRPLRGGRLRGAGPAPAAGPRGPDRRDLDDRVAAPVLRRPGARLRRRVARACRAPSSWPSSARCSRPSRSARPASASSRRASSASCTSPTACPCRRPRPSPCSTG